ncbi:MAG TPA: PilW family protein [Polyangia bacterium]|nr:PilW family protein [Polyangia bacterium]
MQRQRARRRDSGLTLVEVLVTITIASFITAATFAFFAGQQRIYDTQSKLLGVQQNLWSAMDTVSRYVRLAGKGMLGCVRPDSDAAGPDPGDPPCGGSTAPQTGARAWRTDLGFIRIAPLWIKNGAAGAPDTLTVAYGLNSSGNFTDATLANDVQANKTTVPINVLANETLGFRSGEFMMLIERNQANGDRGCTLFQVTGTTLATNTLLKDSAGSVWNPTADVAAMVPFAYIGGAAPTGGVRTFGELTWIQFAIDSSGSAPPRLTMNRLDGTRGPEVLADGIEDMQIAYACDVKNGAPDGNLDEGTDPATRRTDEWTYNEAGDVEPAGCNRPDAIRITLVARSLTPDTTLVTALGNAKPPAEDGVAGAVDQFRHRVATIAIYPRN